MDDLVTIAIPTYERPEMLRRILECATNQSYKNIEIIISDNASVNPEVRKIAELFSQVDLRIRYFRQAYNLGVLANVKFLLDQARGKYFCIFSDDDWRSPEFVEILKERLDKNPNITFAFCDYLEVDENGKRVAGYPGSHLKIFSPFQNNKKLFRLLHYYWQDAKKGKPNLFYSLFRLDDLQKIDLKKISGNFSYLNMDCLLVFSILKSSPALITNDLLCTLTCGNVKYYEGGNIGQGRKKNLFSFFSYHWEDKRRYLTISDGFLLSMLINCIFPIKILYLLGSHIMVKAHSVSKTNCPKEKLVKFQKIIKLPEVTLVAMATKDVEATVEALKYSCQEVEYADVKLLSHYTPYNLPKNFKFYRVEKNKDVAEWGKKIIYDLYKYIDTDYALLVHADGFVVNPHMWRDEFLEYDYIGAPWPLPNDSFSFRDINNELVRVGNSVSLRSKKILEMPSQLGLPWEADHGYFHEDGFLCVKNRHLLIENGIKFAPLEIAKYFSHEVMIPELKNIKPFAFHKWAGTNKAYPKFH